MAAVPARGPWLSWINYYSHFFTSALYQVLQRIGVFLIRWAGRGFKRFTQMSQAARDRLGPVVRHMPDLFAHWSLLYGQGLNAERFTYGYGSARR